MSDASVGKYILLRKTEGGTQRNRWMQEVTNGTGKPLVEPKDTTLGR